MPATIAAMSKRITSLDQAYREVPSVHTILDCDKIAQKHGRIGTCTIAEDKHGKRLFFGFARIEDIAAFVHEATGTHDWVSLYSDIAEHSIYPNQPNTARTYIRTLCAYLDVPGFDRAVAYLTPAAATEHRMNLVEQQLAAKAAKGAGAACRDDGEPREFHLTGDQIRIVTDGNPKFMGFWDHPGRTWRVYHDGWHKLNPDAAPGRCPWAA